MAYSCVIDADQGIAEIVLSHSVTERDVVGALKEVYESTDWRPEFSTLWDATNISELVIDQDGLQEIVDLSLGLQPVAASGKVAVVVRRKLDETLTKILIYMTKSMPRERCIFKTRKDALAWLIT